jgi:hypothetical protein
MTTVSPSPATTSATPMLLAQNTRIGAIAGVMKSGTSWLSACIDDHPDIMCRGEMHPFERLREHPTLVRQVEWSHLLWDWIMMPNNGWNREFRNDPAARRLGFEDDLSRFAFEWNVRQAIEAEGRADNPPAWVIDKSPVHSRNFLGQFDRVLHNYPRAVIHLVRDPRDVVVSNWYHTRTMQYRGNANFGRPFTGPDDRDACTELLELGEDQLDRHRHFFTYPGFMENVLREWNEVNTSLAMQLPHSESASMTVGYEALKADKATQLSAVFEFLGVDPAPAGVAEFGGGTDASGRKRSTMLRKGTGGEWQRIFTPEDHALVDQICGATMARFGYE